MIILFTTTHTPKRGGAQALPCLDCYICTDKRVIGHVYFSGLMRNYTHNWNYEKG